MKRSEQRAWSHAFTCSKCGFQCVIDAGDLNGRENRYWDATVRHVWAACPTCGWDFFHVEDWKRRCYDHHGAWARDGGMGSEHRVDGDLAGIVPCHVYEQAADQTRRKERALQGISDMLHHVGPAELEEAYQRLLGAWRARQAALLGEPSELEPERARPLPRPDTSPYV